MTLKKIRIITYNTWHGLDYRRPYLMLPIEPLGKALARFRAQKDALRETLSERTDDELWVCCLQELNPLWLRIKSLRKALGVRGYGKIANAGIRLGLLGLPPFLSEGIATFFKGPLHDAVFQSRVLSGHRNELKLPLGLNFFFQLSENRVALKLKGEFEGLEIAVFQTHLHAGPRSKESTARRTLELKKLARWVKKEQKKCDLVFIAGDFNNEPDSKELRPLKDLGFSSKKNEITWSPETNVLCHFPSGGTRSEADVEWDLRPHCFDRTYFWVNPLSKKLEPGSFQAQTKRLFDSPLSPLSDHYAIESTFTFKRPIR